MKNLLKELVLPAFWLFFFIAFSKSEVRDNKVKKVNNTELKKQDLSKMEGGNPINKNKEATFTKAIYLSGY